MAPRDANLCLMNRSRGPQRVAPSPLIRPPPNYLEWLVHVQHAAGQFENVVADRALLVRVLHPHRTLAQALDQDVAHVVHLQLEALPEREVSRACASRSPPSSSLTCPMCLMMSRVAESLMGFSNPPTPILRQEFGECKNALWHLSERRATLDFDGNPPRQIALLLPHARSVVRVKEAPLVPDARKQRDNEGAREPEVPEAVEAVVRAVDGDDRGARVGLGHAPVALQDDQLGPDLVVDGSPLLVDLLNVVLRKEREEEKVSLDEKCLLIDSYDVVFVCSGSC